MPELTARYDNLFFTLGNTTSFTDSVIDILKDMRDAGTIGNRVAMVNVADAFGIELAEAARPKIKEAGFDIVYDKSYPLGTPDLSPIIKGAKDSNPDAFAKASGLLSLAPLMICLLYTSPSPRDKRQSRMPSSA